VGVGVAASETRKSPIFPPSITLSFFWCGLTLLWSPTSIVGLTRLLLTGAPVVAVFVYAETFGQTALWRIVSGLLALLVVGSLISGVVVPDLAIHQANDPEGGLVGDWRGILFHKNNTGFVAAISAIVYLKHSLTSPRLHNLLLLAASIVLVYLSGAKTSMIALPLALFFSETLVRAVTVFGRPMTFWALGLVVFALGLLTWSEWQAIENFLADPHYLTGRTAIWVLLVRLASDGAWLFGTGFSSLFGVGQNTPLAPYLSGWTRFAGHGHNGYLELLVSIGIVGLGLTVYSFLVKPLWLLLNPNFRWPETPSAVCILLFIAVHNLTESTLLVRVQPAWLMLIIVAATAFTRERAPPQQSARMQITNLSPASGI
jgi:O-antigen ligase